MLGLFRTKTANNVTPQEVRRRLDEGDESFQLVDVRTPAEFRAGHIPGATLIPVAEIGNRHGELDPDREIIVYCKTSARSRRACAVLAKLGYECVYNMSGGMVAWSRLSA